MRVLVTGHLGFIGGYLMKKLQEQDHEVFGIDEKDGLDILFADMMVHNFRPQMVFHLAARHFIPWCRKHPTQTYQVNAAGTGRVLMGLEGLDCVKSIVLASSAAVYGFGNQPFYESDILRPRDVYGLSKVDAENLLKVFSRASAASCTSLRLSNVIGPGDETPHLAPILAGGGTIKLGNMWPKRDYVFAGDVADAMMACATRLGPGYRTYNVSTGIGTSPEELVRVFRDAGKNIRVHQGPGREDDGHLVLDPSLIRREVEWKPVTGLRTVIEQWV